MIHLRFDLLIYRCADWLIHLCADWLIHLCADWLIHLCADWLIHLCVDWLIYRCADWLIYRCVDRLIHLCADWLMSPGGEDPDPMDGPGGDPVPEVHVVQRRVELRHRHVGGDVVRREAILGHEQPGRESPAL